MEKSEISTAEYRALAGVIYAKRQLFARTLLAAINDKRTASWKNPRDFDQLESWGQTQVLTAIDLLFHHFKSGDVAYLDLFGGFVRSHMLDGLYTEQPEDLNMGMALSIAEESWLNELKPTCSPEALALFSRQIQRVVKTLSSKSMRTLRALFIGDCIVFELVSSLLHACSGVGLSFAVTTLADKVLPALRNKIRKLDPAQFDIVFFSPFSHELTTEYIQLFSPRNCLRSTRATQELAGVLIKEVCATVDALASHFECNIYIHNAASVTRSFTPVGGLMRYLTSRRASATVRPILNEGLSKHLEQIRSTTGAHTYLVDEGALRSRFSDFELGRLFFHGASFHPTRLSMTLGQEDYFEIACANAILKTRKTIVCDLDNTLWDGVIGEGAVRHFKDRQKILKELRNRGVLLSINSKNDPKNVRWDGAELQENDFVAPQINWLTKISNMERIRDELNLKTKDFVFIDDRPDEREMMRQKFPEIAVLDATDPQVWRMFQRWCELLPAAIGEDRTEMYRQRAKREQAMQELKQRSNQAEDESAAFRELQLTLKIRSIDRTGLERAAELINRTNQFNLSGSRTTVKELAKAIENRQILLQAEAADKFGTMGVIGIMLAEKKENLIEVPIFVLSCRVFGFGMEYALLGTIKKFHAPELPVHGLYKETQHNSPSRQLYPTSGFTQHDAYWSGTVAQLPDAPAWLNCEYIL